MIKYVYVVHSKLNEDLVRDEFETAEEAIDYAEENKDQETSVEQVEVDVNDFGEVTDVGDSEIIWDIPEVEDALISDDEYVDELYDEEIDWDNIPLDELDSDFEDISDEELAALEAQHDAELDAEADQMATLEDQAMIDAAAREHPVDEAMKVKDNVIEPDLRDVKTEKDALKAAEPVTDEKTIKKSIEDRISDMEAKLGIAKKDADPTKEVDTVCKSTKAILHSEDDVKDLKESLLHEGVSAEAVAVVSELLEDEWEAISGYEDAAAKLAELDVADKDKVLHVLDHISKEESIHVGQLEQIVKLLNPEHIAKQDEGHAEGAEELAGEDPHDEEISVDKVESEPEFVIEDPEIVVAEEALDYNKLREELEENEDTVECQVCYDLVPKENAIKTDGGYYICKNCLKDMKE